MRVALGAFVALILASFLLVRSDAGTFTPGQASSTLNLTNTVSVSGNSSQFITNYVESALYHTFQFVITSTNTGIIAVERGLDGSSWTVVGTNSIAVGTNAVYEQTMTGKWVFSRIRILGTNVTGTAYYLGGR